MTRKTDNFRTVIRGAILVLSTMPLFACTSIFDKSFSHTNIALSDHNAPPARATLEITGNRGRKDTLMIMAMSGGGSRAAYLSAGVMLKLQQVFSADRLDLLAEVDAISSVSGGSLPAAYYAISTDPGDPNLHGRVWEPATVRMLMGRDYIIRWFGNWLWPNNVVKFWFTAFDRSDIMAQTLGDNLFDTEPSGTDLKLGDLNPDRPYLILNATNGTANWGNFGAPFTFTKEDFAKIRSDVNDYSLARAVMATATFPAVFNFMTLKNHAVEANRHIHLFDGGNFDNLGLTSIITMLNTVPPQDIDKLIVILVDAHTGGSGVDSNRSDTRNPPDFIVDTNFLDATDSLLSANRFNKLELFKRFFTNRTDQGLPPRDKSIFYHIQIDDVLDPDMRRDLKKISTNFKLAKSDAKLIDTAIDRLMTVDNDCLQAMRVLLLENSHDADPICSYRH